MSSLIFRSPSRSLSRFLPLLAILLLSLPARADQLKPEDAQAMGKFALTTRLVEKAIAVQKAIAEQHAQLASTPPEKAGDGPPSLDGSAQSLERDPAVAKILKKAGISARQYLLTVICSNQAMMAAQYEKQMGDQVEKDPSRKPTELNVANIGFVQKNDALFAKLADSQRKMRDAFLPKGMPQ